MNSDKLMIDGNKHIFRPADKKADKEVEIKSNAALAAILRSRHVRLEEAKLLRETLEYPDGPDGTGIKLNANMLDAIRETEWNLREIEDIIALQIASARS